MKVNVYIYLFTSALALKINHGDQKLNCMSKSSASPAATKHLKDCNMF